MSKLHKKTHRVRNIQKDTLLIDYAPKAFAILGSKTAVKKAILAGQLKINGQNAQINDTLHPADILELRIREKKKQKINGIDLPIVFEDDFIILVNKPAGIAVNGNRKKTVENALRYSTRKSKQPDTLPAPVATHRIDVPTKGLVLLAKTKSALIRLNKSFQSNEVKKMYWAVVHGKAPEKGQINSPVQGKKASTHYEREKVVPSRLFENLSLLKLFPITGRTHQLRIHLQTSGHLIVGDKQYMQNQKTILGKGLYLCAAQLEFNHPISGKRLKFQIDPPGSFIRLMEREEKRF